MRTKQIIIIMVLVVIAVIIISFFDLKWPEPKGPELDICRDDECKEFFAKQVSFRNNGYEVIGFLSKPEGKGPFPAVVLVHGGGAGISEAQNLGSGPLAKAFVDAGYVVLSIERRKLEEGISDVTASVGYIKTLDYVNPDKAALYGGSYGAFLSVMAASKLGNKIKAVVENYGPTNWVSMYEYDSKQGKSRIKKYRKEVGCIPSECPDRYNEISPVYNVRTISVPVLITHGSADTVVPLSQAYELENALKEAGKTYEILTYKGAEHGYIKEPGPHIQDAVIFLNKYLK